MTRLRLTLVAAIISMTMLGLASPTRAGDGAAAELSVMSFNVLHRALSLRRERAWKRRRASVIATIARESPDIVGLQEAGAPQVKAILAGLEGYAVLGPDPKDSRIWRWNAVLYKEELFALVARGELSLAEEGSEDKPSWGAALPRYAQWCVLRHRKRGGELLVINTHFSSTSARARERSAELLRRRLPKLAGGRPALIIGDFNAAPGSAPYKTLVGEDAALRDAYAEARAPKDQATLHGDRGGSGAGRRVDHILLTGALRCARARVVTEEAEGCLPSDHFPVLVRVRWPAARPAPRRSY